MNQIVNITVVGLIAGIIGTGIGGLFSFFIASRTTRLISSMLEFAAGLMVAVICFDLLPEAFSLGGIFVTIAGLVFGIVVIIMLHSHVTPRTREKRNHLLSTGIYMAIGIALHNFPEGLAIGSGFEASSTLGFNLALVMMLHNIPEGLSMVLPMQAGGMKQIKTILYSCLAGIPMGIGALIGGLLGEISPLLITICLSFAAGAMLYIVSGDIIPESKGMYRGRMSCISNVLGMVCGIILSLYFGA